MSDTQKVRANHLATRDLGEPLPGRLTARARRLLERGRDLLARLRALGETLTDEADPLSRLARDTSAMIEAAVRSVQTFPDTPSLQLPLCHGLDVVLDVAEQRLASLGRAVGERLREEEQIATLAEWLTALSEGRADFKAFVALAEAVVAEALDAAPLRFVHAPATEPARYLACHSLTTARVVARVARLDPELRLRPVEPVVAALVHDVGMLRLPPDLLVPPRPLHDGERRRLEAHTRVGAELLRRLCPEAPWLAEAAAGHHERGDGTGYPAGLKAAQVSSLTRLLATCDVYAALCCPRPWRPAVGTRQALTEVLQLAEAGALDPSHVERLLTLSFYPVGTAVEMTDGAVAVVVATHPGRHELAHPARPVVAVLTDAQGQPLASPAHLDLARCEGRGIVRALGDGERRRALGGSYPQWA